MSINYVKRLVEQGHKEQVGHFPLNLVPMLVDSLDIEVLFGSHQIRNSNVQLYPAHHGYDKGIPMGDPDNGVNIIVTARGTIQDYIQCCPTCGKEK